MKKLALAAGLLLVVGLTAGPAAADAFDDKATAAAPDEYKIDLLAKAKPDECFDAVGLPYPAGPPCATGTAKVNQAYVWGMTQVGTDIWFGTGANTHCLTSGATLDVIEPVINDDWVCEYGESQIAKADPDIPIEVGDMRPPEVWTYDVGTKESVNKSAEIRAKGADDTYRLAHTIGLRAAGNFNGVVLLGGPTTDQQLNMYAFDAATKQYLGSHTYESYGNIRTFLQHDGALYLGVGIGRNGVAGGAVLRWTGSIKSPFDFISVANLPVQAADLTVNDGRLAATSWPADGSGTNPAKMAGVWISPPLADGEPGLNPEDSDGWAQVWNAGLYEPDKVTASTYGLGGVASYGGYLYWGTMHVPTKATKVHKKLYPQPTEEATETQVKYTQRGISIFRGKNLGTPEQKIELLYGNTQLPVYDAPTGTWSAKTTNYTPVFGSAGFGQGTNNYTWRMIVNDGKLFVGTMDWSYMVDKVSPPADTKAIRQGLASNGLAPDPAQYGGDLWMFSSPDTAATPVNTTGLGNVLNYGVRNMIVNGDGLYLGMANPMNRRTDPTDDIPEGGWELLSLEKVKP